MTLQVPTILIGLGGIGSTVTHQIYERLPEERRKKVAMHVFDTDVNTLSKFDHIRKFKTQTSSSKTPREYIAGDPTIPEWFPMDPTILDKPLTEGAGQLRVISRLALRAAMKEDKLTSFWQEIEKIFPVTSDQTEYGVRVIIVTSLAGGTGSGMFLQIALYLREMLRKKLQHHNILIRGAFLMPDVLVKTRTVSAKEFETVQANGYASLKELHAITLGSTGELSKRGGVTIELEYRPDQVDEDGRTNHTIKQHHLPYNYCFLYDYENLHGHHLHNLSDYMEQMANTIYLQLFSPMSANHFAQEDNQIQQLAESSGKGRYCGAGTAKIIYPYEHVLKYCALKWAVQGLDESWLHLDQLFQEKKQRYDQDVKRGMQREKPERGKSYLEDLEHLATRPEQAHIFYRQIYNETREGAEGGKVGIAKSKLFLEAVESYVQRTVQKDEELNRLQHECKISAAKLKMTEQMKGEVARVDHAVRLYAYAIPSRVHEHVTTLLYDMIESDRFSPSGSEGQSYQLNTWFLKKTDSVHPVAARFMLYEIRKQLVEKMNRLHENNEQKRNLIQNYDKKFNVSNIDGTVTAVRRVEIAQQQGWFGKMINNQQRLFKKEFEDIVTQYVHKLNEYRKEMLLELVYQSLYQAVNKMIQYWERFFDNLHETRENLLFEIQKRSKEFEGKTNPTNVYVLAEEKLQEKIWQDMQQHLNLGVLPKDICAEIYMSLYGEYCRDAKTEEIQSKKVEDFYREHILSYCYDELQVRYRDKLELNIVEALRKEADYKKRDRDEYVREKIEDLFHLASPFVPKVSHHRELQYWGIHPSLKKELQEELMQEMFKEKDTVNEAFSPFEVICYRAHYGLSLQDFPKLSSGHIANGFMNDKGDYFQSYYRRVNKLNSKKSSLTPHLDKYWHLPAFMPDLNATQTKLDYDKCNRALLYAYIYRWISLVAVDGQFVYQYNGVGRSFLIQSMGKNISSESYKLHRALLHNPFIYENILSRFEEEQEKAMIQGGHLYTHPFVLGAQDIRWLRKEHVHNILDMILMYDREAKYDPTLEETSDELLRLFLDEIELYFQNYYGTGADMVAKKEKEMFIKQLWDRSYAKGYVDPNSAPYKKWQNLLSVHDEEESPKTNV
ncbi:phosphonate ABC transporter permease [Bacillus anthracis]|uniref:tubulin-like doman-containing protein n=1 Tax=Bacillus tropicus TaxID=2026188 RepID=UPI000BF38350|nr:tubulin-like doman-containing protein [Bacillus tropicus]PEU79161.1 phosphonate ABC transporter permease [Bacillus anthracis]PEZ72640.1 phosphonate ABC transporter permease [Bacillus anthracis]PGQ85453.1 phosphonate ABC transporter permease [Bacillus anthracis]PGS98798.1 phosphonate ABC transporter permease [Bacillus anthracis]PGX56240.1 phosphonate ABC transporter permease [Bacillus anthracis]